MLRIVAGSAFGLPSPGHTTLTSTGGGTWNVDSFFDMTYRIEFVGCKGSLLDGLAGTTQATIRMQTSTKPSCVGGCSAAEVCRRTENRLTVARKRYNDSVKALNTFSRKLLGRIYAGWAGVEKAEYFEITHKAKATPKVDFSGNDAGG